jgi:uncharacterized membrane protein YoaK (UPF0700 family)
VVNTGAELLEAVQSWRSSEPALPERVVTLLLAVLTAAAGSLDVFCLTRLNGLFASVITGNLVQLGRAIASTDAWFAVEAATTVGSYGLGVAAGTAALRRCAAGWRRRTTLLLTVEVVLLIGLVAGWLATDARPVGSASPLLLGLAAAAMGIQSAVTIASGVRGASTTYLTGTLTDAVRAVVGDPHRLAGGAAGRLAALLFGACLGALVLRLAPAWAPVLAAALVAAVLLAATLAQIRIERR